MPPMMLVPRFKEIALPARTRKNWNYFTSALVALTGFAGSSFALASGIFEQIGEEVNALFVKAKPALVQVRADTPGLAPTGTGFFIDNQGTLLTSAAVLGDASTARVTYEGLEMEAKIIGKDERSGVALLQVAVPETPHLLLGRSSDLKTGYALVALGFPFNLPVAPGSGLVCGFDVRYLDNYFATTHIHANIAISPGEIGGPLLNAKGEVVGLMVTSQDDGRTVYALPSEAVQKIMADFVEYGHARHGWVGVKVDDALNAPDGRSVVVSEIVPDTPAAASGLARGDTVMRIDAREIYRPADVVDASFFSRVGSTINVVVRREDRLLTFNFVVSERPPETSPPPASNTQLIRAAARN